MRDLPEAAGIMTSLYICLQLLPAPAGWLSSPLMKIVRIVYLLRCSGVYEQIYGKGLVSGVQFCMSTAH